MCSAPSVLTFHDVGCALHIKGHECSRGHRTVQKLVEFFYKKQPQEINKMKTSYAV